MQIAKRFFMLALVCACMSAIVSAQAVKGSMLGTITDSKVTTELRFLWADLGESPETKRQFLFNVEAYPNADSKTPSHVSSLWLIGTQPNWHSGYYQAMLLKTRDQSK